MVKCITSTRFSLLADVLKQAGEFDYVIDEDEQSYHRTKQNPLTGAIEREWVPVVGEREGGPKVLSVKCDINGILDGGIRVAGTTERFDKEYNNVDFAHMWFPKHYNITKRDRITNVRTARTGEVIWVEEELDPDEDGQFVPTVFNVLGVTPVKDAFGQWMECRALLARADQKMDDDG